MPQAEVNSLLSSTSQSTFVPSLPSIVSSEVRSIETGHQATQQAGKNDQIQNTDKAIRATATTSLPSYTNAGLIALQNSEPAINSLLELLAKKPETQCSRKKGVS